MKLLLVLFLLTPLSSLAAGAASGIDLFGGGGLGFGTQSMPGSSAGESKFLSQGYFLEAGILFPFSVAASVEYGVLNTTNTLTSQTDIEIGSNSFYALKAGLHFNKFGIGGGMRSNDIVVKSISTSSGYLESTYSGSLPVVYANMHLEIDKMFSTAIEGQYISGDLSSSNPALPSVKFTEMMISLRFFIVIK